MVSVVFGKISVSLLTILAGFIGATMMLRTSSDRDGAARELRSMTTRMSQLVLDVALPALAFTQILKSDDRSALMAAWTIPVVGFLLLALSAVLSIGVARLSPPTETTRTVLFLAATPNWIFLPLPIVEALFHSTGTRAVFLCNVGARLWLWTGGVVILGGHADLRRSMLAVAARPGFWVTIVALPLAILFPALARFDQADLMTSGALGPVYASLQAFELIGTLSLPLTFLSTGAQLAEPTDSRAPVRTRELVVAIVGRLVLIPLAMWPIIRTATFLDPDTRTSLAIVLSMPVAASSSMFTRLFGGNDALAARSIVWSTVLSLVTVPVLLAMFAR